MRRDILGYTRYTTPNQSQNHYQGDGQITRAQQEACTMRTHETGFATKGVIERT